MADDDAALAKVEAAFGANGLKWECTAHEPVLTVEAGLAAVGALKCSFAKNLFVKDKKAGLFLLTVTHDRKVDMKKLPELLGLSGGAFRFADGAVLAEKLGVKQGAVTPLAVMNDAAGEVKLVLDAELMAAPRIGVHPLRNDRTVVMPPADLTKFVTTYKV